MIFINYGKCTAFLEHLPEVQKEHFQAIVREGQLIARMVLQMALDIADIVACLVSMTVVMMQAS